MRELLIPGIISGLNMLPKELITFILAALPVSELRGAIPYGVHNNIPYARVLLLALAGNLLSVIPLYFLLNKIMVFLNRFRAGKKFSQWLVSHTLKKSKVIEVYETVGLIIFVGIPLPVTGAWTGTIAAVLLKLRFRYYIIGITGGVFLAAAVVSVLNYAIRGFFRV